MRVRFSVNGGETVSEENREHLQHWNSEEGRKQMARAVYASRTMFGRTMILTSAEQITDENVVKIVSQAYQTHLLMHIYHCPKIKPTKQIGYKYIICGSWY